MFANKVSNKDNPYLRFLQLAKAIQNLPDGQILDANENALLEAIALRWFEPPVAHGVERRLVEACIAAAGAEPDFPRRGTHFEHVYFPRVVKSAVQVSGIERVFDGRGLGASARPGGKVVGEVFV